MSRRGFGERENPVMADIPDRIVLQRPQGLTQDDYSLTGALLAVGTSGPEGSRSARRRGGSAAARASGSSRSATPDHLAEAARKEGIAKLDDVEWAVMETSRSISFIRKPHS